jgi:hypothetical protein
MCLKICGGEVVASCSFGSKRRDKQGCTGRHVMLLSTAECPPSVRMPLHMGAAGSARSTPLLHACCCCRCQCHGVSLTFRSVVPLHEAQRTTAQHNKVWIRPRQQALSASCDVLEAAV